MSEYGHFEKIEYCVSDFVGRKPEELPDRCVPRRDSAGARILWQRLQNVPQKLVTEGHGRFRILPAVPGIHHAAFGGFDRQLLGQAERTQYPLHVLEDAVLPQHAVELLELGASGHAIFDSDAIWPNIFAGDIRTGLVLRAWYEYRGGDDVKLFPRTKNDCAGTQIARPQRLDLCRGVALRSAWRDGKGLSVDIDAVVSGTCGWVRRSRLDT